MLSNPCLFTPDAAFWDNKEVHLLSSDVAFSLTTLTSDTQWLREHQTRFLAHTHLKALHWINFNHHQIEFATLDKS